MDELWDVMDKMFATQVTPGIQLPQPGGDGLEDWDFRDFVTREPEVEPETAHCLISLFDLNRTSTRAHPLD